MLVLVSPLGFPCCIALGFLDEVESLNKLRARLASEDALEVALEFCVSPEPLLLDAVLSCVAALRGTCGEALWG